MFCSLKKVSTIAGAALAVSTLLIAAPSANAAAITFSGSGTSSDGNLAASGIFTTNSGNIVITLTNTLLASAIVSPGQALSDVTFTLSNAPGALGTATGAGQLGNFSTDSPVTYITGAPTRWTDAGSITVNGNTVHMTAIGGGQPDNMILPSVPNGGSYPNDNMGVDNFIPYIIGPGTFTLNFAGITAATTVSGVSFSFGTSDSEHVIPGTGGGSGAGQTVPEPASLVLFGATLLGAAYRARRNRK